MASHVLAFPYELVKVEGPARFGPKRSKRSWCSKVMDGHLYDADRFYAALMRPKLDMELLAEDPYAQAGAFYEPHWDFACEECAKRLGWLAGQGGGQE